MWNSWWEKNQHDNPLVDLLQINILNEEMYFEGKMRFKSWWIYTLNIAFGEGAQVFWHKAQQKVKWRFVNYLLDLINANLY